jgi:aspartate/methionine/tyrosine aminotransferase
MFASRTKEISPFVVMQLLQRAEEYERVGKTVVHLEVGEPDFQTAEPIVDAAHAAIDAGRTKYTSASGIPDLRERISAYYQSMGVSVSSDRIMVTSGASGGLTLLAGLLLDPTDRLLITDPGYPCNDVFARLVGAIPKPIAVSAEHRFQPTLANFQSAWCEQTRGALLASPGNPTGTMLSAQDLADMAAFALSRQGFLILDEIYQGLHHREPEYVSGLAVTKDVYVLNSFSKFFGMTGWRLGWVVVPDHAIEPITALAQNLFISPSAPAQYAALAAFDDDAMAIHKARQQAFVSRAGLLSRGLEALGFTIPVVPDGAFYLYVDISHTGMNSTDFCWRLIDEYQVAVTPGADFGCHQAESHVRFAYTTDEQSIALGLERIADALRAWGVGQ